jgi:hypothetical protein
MKKTKNVDKDRVVINTLLETSKSKLGEIIYDIKDKINDSIPMYGEFGHHSSYDLNLKNVSHLVKNATINGTNGDLNLCADIVLLDTDDGAVVKEMLDVNDCNEFTYTPFSVSARYVGGVDIADANGAVVTISKLLTYDIVPDSPEQIKQKKIEARKRKINSILK